jgi:ubiquinone/menaquinone biosynthesis C-methylase UbiE
MADSLNQCAGPFGAIYDFYIERPRLMRAIGRLVWGVDTAVLYRSIEESVGAAGEGITVIDVPCGGGIALRGLRAGRDVRYLAGDLSPKMLARTRARAQRRSLDRVRVLEADMLALPFADGEADLFLSYSGLHMVSEPRRAVREIARCLKPGGRLAGTTFLYEGSRRQRMLFEAGGRKGHALPPRRHELLEWLARDGFEDLELAPARGFAAFRARRA